MKNRPLAPFNSNYFSPGTIKYTIDTLLKYGIISVLLNMTSKSLVTILRQNQCNIMAKFPGGHCITFVTDSIPQPCSLVNRHENAPEQCCNFQLYRSILLLSFIGGSVCILNYWVSLSITSLLLHDCPESLFTCISPHYVRMVG